MATALKKPALEVSNGGYPMVEMVRTTLTANLEEDIAHGGPDGVAPQNVSCSVVVPATTTDGLNFEWHEPNSNVTNNTIRVRWGGDAAADFTAMEVMLRIEFPAMKSGGISIS